MGNVYISVGHSVRSLPCWRAMYKDAITGSFTAISIPMYKLTCTVYFVTPTDTLLKDTSRLICLFSRLRDPCAIADWLRTTQ